MKKNILVTGGAGFIGSNLVSALLKDDRVEKVRVLDNISTGYYKNIAGFRSNPSFEFIEGDIRDWNICLEACQGMDLVNHQAALGSVPRSIADPVTSNSVNVSGSVNVFIAAKESGIDKVVYAASSSAYGDNQKLPKIEGETGKPLSPYAVSKFVSELYADVYARSYGIQFIGLRYFNVFGPNQDPNSDYAAVIPRFFKAALAGKTATINGDGTFSRDFTFVKNVVNANLLALFSNELEADHQVFNIGCGERMNLNELWKYICQVVGVDIKPIHGPIRKGDIPHSLADISKARTYLNYKGDIKVKEGLDKSFSWYKDYFNRN